MATENQLSMCRWITPQGLQSKHEHDFK